MTIDATIALTHSSLLAYSHPEGHSTIPAPRPSPDCHIATIVISPFTKPGTQYGKKPFNHYSLLRTTEELLKIKKKNWVGLSKKAKSMKSAFHL
jgi:hypothetical protein